VLAASSRPDLVDPALLRPGRLDKCLYCAMPDADERLDILRRLACKLSLEEDVDLEWLAAERRTRGFSGADLQSLLYSAQLLAVHERLDHLQSVTGDGEDDGSDAHSSTSSSSSATSSSSTSATLNSTRPRVSGAHLRQALTAQRPSVTEVELVQLTAQYSKFLADRGADFQTGLLEGQRQTLA
jgi:peroxin-1